MRAVLLITLFWCVACGGGGPSGSTGPTQAAALRLVEGSNSTVRILPLDDGTTIVAARASGDASRFVDPSNAEPPTDLAGEQFLICYDANGRLLWHQAFGDDVRWLDLDASPDGHVLALGVTSDAVRFGSLQVSRNTTYAHTYFLLRLNRAGEPLSIATPIHTNDPNGGDPRGRRIAVHADGSYAIMLQTGTRFRVEPSSTVAASELISMTLARYNAAGGLEWRKFCAVSRLGIFDILANGHVIASAEFPIDGRLGASFAEGGAGIVTLGGDGGFSVASIALGASFSAEGFVECADGYAISGRRRGELTVGATTIPDDEGGILLRITGAGELAWHRVLGDGVGFDSLARDPDDGNLLAAGAFRMPYGDRFPEGRQDGMLAKFADADGARLWLRTFSAPEWLTVSDAWFAPDGEIGISGQASGPSRIALPGGEFDFDADDILFMLRLR